MGDDIREIESQNRALQILNSNQHSLISELDGLLVIKITNFLNGITESLVLYIYIYIYIDSHFYTQKMSR